MARKNLLKGFKKPKGISFEPIDSTNPNYQKFYAYPFETGFGTTVGNTLRRILLSSIQGYAITSIRITSYDENGIPHVISSEFEAIPNVTEDTLEIINSLKQIRLCLPDDIEQDTINYEFKGPGVVKSNDFAKEGQLEVLTKDMLVFTMMENAHIDVEIQVAHIDLRPRGANRIFVHILYLPYLTIFVEWYFRKQYNTNILCQQKLTFTGRAYKARISEVRKSSSLKHT